MLLTKSMAFTVSDIRTPCIRKPRAATSARQLMPVTITPGQAKMPVRPRGIVMNSMSSDNGLSYNLNTQY